MSADVAAHGPEVRLGLGAENFWDDVLHGRLRERTVPAYGGGPAFLFEVNPQLMPPGLENELFQLRVSGMLPVMAHPERYVAIQRDVDLAERIGRHAVLMVDLGALDGAHGRTEMKTARKLVQEGLAHAAATDIHRPDDGKGIAGGMAWIRKQFGPAMLQQTAGGEHAAAADGRDARSAPHLTAYFSPASSTTGAPSSTESPSLTSTADTLPAAGDSTGISIFIDSSMTTVCPSATASPTLTSIFHTVPVMCALTWSPWRARVVGGSGALQAIYGIDAAMWNASSASV